MKRLYFIPFTPALLGISLSCLFIQAIKAANSSEPLLQKARDVLMLEVQHRKVFGNVFDPIAISELPGYTGWPRNRIGSKVDQCFVTRMGNQKTFTLDGSILRFDGSKSTKIWTVSIACPKITVTADRGLLPMPLFYARAYGPAIVAGSQKASSSVVQNGVKYSETEISFAIKDPGLYAVEVVLESIFTPNVYAIPARPGLDYDGFLLPGFPLLLNATRIGNRCETAKACNMTLCSSKDIQSDFTASSGRWIVLGKIDKLPQNTSKKVFDGYSADTIRLGIKTDYKPIDCVLAPIKSAAAVLDACVVDTGLHFIFIGDSVTGQHFQISRKYLNSNLYRFSPHMSIGWGGIDNTFVNVSQQLLQIKQENSSRPKVVVFNAGLHEIQTFCKVPLNASNSDVLSCAEHYRSRFKRLLDFVALTFPSDLKIFRTTNAAWMRWGNFGFSWAPSYYQNMVECPNTVRIFNDIALQVIRDSGYDIKVYDLFWMTYSRPDNTETRTTNDAKGHMVHLGHDTLKASVRKMITIVAEHFGCWK